MSQRSMVCAPAAPVLMYSLFINCFDSLFYIPNGEFTCHSKYHYCLYRFHRPKIPRYPIQWSSIWWDNLSATRNWWYYGWVEHEISYVSNILLTKIIFDFCIGAFNNYVDRNLPLIDPPPHLVHVSSYWMPPIGFFIYKLSIGMIPQFAPLCNEQQIDMRAFT